MHDSGYIALWRRQSTETEKDGRLAGVGFGRGLRVQRDRGPLSILYCTLMAATYHFTIFKAQERTISSMSSNVN